MDIDFYKKFIPAIIAGAAISTAIMYNSITNAPDDNLVEEVAEKIVNHQTGIEIDLTPCSKE